MTPLYSIIIPHYNIPDLLMRCLRSIPVREDVQVIVVDDCSPGAEHYKESYPELSRPYLEFYSTTQSGSAGRARNVGLDHAKGRWLLFADADDLFADNIESILEQYKESEEDLLYFRVKSVLSEDITKPASRSQWLDDLWADFEQNHDIASLCGRCPVVWGKMFRRSLIEQYHIRCDETHYSNDFWFSACAACYAERVGIEKEIIYHPTVRQGSLAYGMNEKAGELEQRAEVCFRVEKLLLDHHIKTLPFEPFTMYLCLLFDKGHRPLYYQYFRQLPQIGFSRSMALREMCANAGRRRKLKVWLLSYIHLISK